MTVPDATATSVFVGGVVAIIGALTTATVKIIRALQHTRRIVVESHDAEQKRGKVRDAKLEQIKVLVNGRLLTALRLLVSVTKKEAARTGEPADDAIYQHALAELRQAEAGASEVHQQLTHDLSADEAAAQTAEQAIAALTGTEPRRRSRNDD